MTVTDLTKSENGISNPGFIRELEEDQTQNKNGNLDRFVIDDAEAAVLQRGRWGNSIEFLMSCIAMSVGLGNVWRFPFTAYENGGGAFLIPYLIVLTIIGRPFYYMEMALGQFSSCGSVKLFTRLAPGMSGIGYGQLIGITLVGTYYCSLMGITLFYFLNSFTGDLPWATCKDYWAEELAAQNITCVAASESASNTTVGVSKSSSELWFRMDVLKETVDISNGIGTPDWRLVLCLFGAWTICYIVARRGVKSSGKAAYFLAIFPYVVLLTLLVRAVTLPGANKGMLYFIAPQWEKLLDAKVWYAAVTQSFFSLNVGYGTIITYSSYNDFEHNINRDVVVVSILDTLASLIAGTTIFGILGNLAFELGLDDIKDVLNSGTGLAFISYPEAIAKFSEVPWVFALLFFIMLLALGIGSLMSLQGVYYTCIVDSFPNLKGWQLSLSFVLFGAVVGIVYTTPGGQHMVTVVDFFAGTFVIYTMAVIEFAFVVWYYGLENICNDIEFMMKKEVSVYYKFCWGLLTPSLLIVIFVYFLISITPLDYEHVPLPDSVQIGGWCIVILVVGQFLAWLAYHLWSNRGRGSAASIVGASLRATDHWGPVNKARYEEWRLFRERRAAATAHKDRHGRFVRFLLTCIGK